MLRAFFDDSGTHSQSPIVVVAGLCGTESEISSLDGLWRELLANPLEGLKPPLREFHAHDCFNSRGEFSSWRRTETDYIRDRFRQAIIKSHVSGYGFACVRDEYNTEITGDFRKYFGDAEGYAYTNCFVRSLRWANRFTFDPDISFVFDNKPERQREIEALFVAFRLYEQNKKIHAPCQFLESVDTPCLQAADLFAWEFLHNARDIYNYGMAPPRRDEMKQLANGMYFLDGQIARAPELREIKANILNTDMEAFDFAVKHFGPFRR